MEMNWLQVLVISFGNLAWMLPLFLWLRSESRADARHFDQENKELRRELIDCVRALQEDAKTFREQWASESREFHGRLCAIEEKRNKG